MSKVKKTIIACVIFALLLIGTLYGLTIYSASLPTPGDLSYLDEEPETEEGTKYPVLTEETYFGSNWAEYIDDPEGYYLPILKKADSKYIWLDPEDGIWGVSKNKLQKNMIKAVEEEGAELYLTDVDHIMTMIECVTKNFTEGYNQSMYKGKAIGWKFGWDTLIDAFGNVFPEDEVLSDANHNANVLKEKGLTLKMKNIEVEKVLCSNNYVYYNDIILQVGADVTCKEKSEVFEGLDWIPEVGETRHITFVYYCYQDKQMGGRIYPKNIHALYEE